MPKVLPAIFSYGDMKSRWNQDNPNEPFNRDDSLQNGIYAIDEWLIRVDDNNKAIATGGWKEYPSHTVVGGLLAVERADRNHPEHDPKLKGNARAIQDAREPQLNQSKPVIASFNQKRGDNARWIATAKNTQGFVFSDDPEWEKAISVLPQEVVEEWTKNSGNRWGIRNILNSESLAKCVYPDDPMPAWFNVIKYLPDNTWDDFELGEPAPDLGTRDRFKDKNIKSKGKAEYKAFITQQYLRQVSDRIPNAGTSLMKGWLEKLNELDLDKGKYWYFGTNVKQDRTYVMIDVIEKGQTYTRTAGKKFNLEGMDKGIVFIGVSKEMVGKIKRGQGIPKGRKFIDLHGKYGVRGLRGKRKLPKQPTNPFPKPQDIEKSWENILKWRPDGKYEDFTSYKTKDDGGKTSKIHEDARTLPIIAGGHYIYRGLNRVREEERSLLNTTQLTEFGEKILSSGFPHRRGYFPIKEGSRLKILFDIVPHGEVLPQQRGITSTERLVTNNSGGDVLVFTTMFTTKKPKNSNFFNMWDEEEQEEEEEEQVTVNENLEEIQEEKPQETKKTKMELWKKYSDEFDNIAEAREEYATSIENIKAMGGMSPETKSKKLLETDDKIRQLTADLRTIYYSFMRDLRANGHKVLFRKR